MPFSTWSLAKLAEFLVAEGGVDDISHEGLGVLLSEEDVSFQVMKAWKASTDADFEAKNRVVDLYDLMDGRREGEAGDPDVVVCMDEFRSPQPAAPPGTEVGDDRDRGQQGPRRPAPTPQEPGHLSP